MVTKQDEQLAIPAVESAEELLFHEFSADFLDYQLNLSSFCKPMSQHTKRGFIRHDQAYTSLQHKPVIYVDKTLAKRLVIELS